ncbi:MAG: hypothetical protein M1812_002089 [Candelaria pacifica]|nr:MAG: hypothetical protein M1812_002089 [Candelaria pacifica]
MDIPVYNIYHPLFFLSKSITPSSSLNPVLLSHQERTENLNIRHVRLLTTLSELTSIRTIQASLSAAAFRDKLNDMSTTATIKSLADLKAAYKRLDKPTTDSINRSSKSILEGVCTSDAEIVRVYNLHGDLDHLVLMTFIATKLRNTPGRAIFVVDDQYYEDAFDMLTKHFDDMPHKIDPKDEEWVKFERFTVVLGGDEDRHARRAGGEVAEEHKKFLEAAVARVLECLKGFAPKNREYPQFIWHNSTSAELPAAMPSEAMLFCKALTFASAVVFYPSPHNFFPGYAYAWSHKSHDLLVANLTKWEIPSIYIDGSAMGFSTQRLSQLPGYVNVWPELFPGVTWEDALRATHDRITLWMMRWAEGIAGRHGEESAKRAKSVFTLGQDASNEANKAEEEFSMPPYYNAESYSKEDCNTEEASKRARAIADDLGCPVNMVLGAAAGMLLGLEIVPKGALLIPIEVDFKKRELAIARKAHKYILTATSSTTLEENLVEAWKEMLARLELVPEECKMPRDIAENWVQNCKTLRLLAKEIGDAEIEKQLRKGDMSRLCEKALR